MAVYEQSDGFIPNKQTPPDSAALGTSASPWGQVIAASVSGTQIDAAGLTLLNRDVPAYFRASVDLVALTAKTITHGLSNSAPLIIVYGSGTNEVLPFGSGVGTVIYAASGATANTVVITATADAPGSTVVIIG